MVTPGTSLVDVSIGLIAENQASSGAYVASPTFATYGYSWFRDGAFIADAMSRHGQLESAEAFFSWCGRIVTERRDRIDWLVAEVTAGRTPRPEEHLHTRYTLDGHEATVPWENFQLDGYGTWLWALTSHNHRHDRSMTPYVEAVELTVRYLAACWAQPSYDWWEEHADQRHTSTLASIRGGLVAASRTPDVADRIRRLAADSADEIADLVANEGVHEGRLTKWLGGTDIDASLVACATPFRLYPPDAPVMKATVDEIERLLAPGGVHRYRADTYYGGGEWILLAGFLGWHHVETGRRQRAEELLAWIESQADEHGHLPEQVDTHLLAPERKAEWDARWGSSATPLLWSHAMYLTLVSSLSEEDASW